MSNRASESPEEPERTGSHPSFAPAPFATRLIPSYPRRAQYASFDPAFPRTVAATGYEPEPQPRYRAPDPAPIEQRFVLEANAGSRGQNVEVDERLVSNPPALDVASHTLRERLPYPDRTMDEMTSCADYPLRQHNISAPVTGRELFAARPYDGAPDWGWPCWADENWPQHTPWIGYDHSNFRIYGGRDAPNETAAVASDTVMQSVEAESDPLVAQRQAANASQRVIRWQLSEAVEMEDRNRELMRQVEVLTRNRDAYLRARDKTQTRLEMVERERDGLRTELDRAQTHVERLQQRVYEPAGELCRRQVEPEEDEVGQQREAELQERVRVLKQSEATLGTDLTSETARADRLQTERDQIAYQHEGMQNMTAQLTATQVLAMQPQANIPTVNAPPKIPAPVVEPPVVVQPPIVAHPAAAARGGGRERGERGAKGRARRGAAAVATRAQPERRCKVHKSYKS